MEQTETTRERIVKTARSLHDQGNTWEEAAEKLDIGTSTLRRYRNDPEYKRGGSKNVGNKVESKMNRGGKLTKLENNYRPDKGEDDETEGPIDGPPISPGRNFEDLRGGMDRSEFPNEAINPVGKDTFPRLDRAIERGDRMMLTVYEHELPSGETRFLVGEQSDIHELTDVRILTFDLSLYEDDVELASEMWDRLLEEEIIGDTP